MSQLRFCNDTCRALYHRVVRKKMKDAKIMIKFALLSSAQSRCGYCGESVDTRKRVKIVELKG